MSDNIKLIIEIPKSDYNAICANKEDAIIAHDTCRRIANNSTPLSNVLTEIKEKINYEYANTRGMFPDYAGGLSHAYEIINKYIDDADFPQAKDIEHTAKNFSKVLDNKLIRDVIQDYEADMRGE